MISFIRANIQSLFLGNGLKNEISRGSLWLGGGTFVEQGTRFVRNLILTRILLPEVFGVMAIMLAVNAAAQSFTEVGVQYAIIQHSKGDDRKFLNGAWWLAFIRGIILYIIGFIIAPFIADFYENEAITILIRVSFLAVLLNGALSPKSHVAIKEMNYKKWVFLYHGGGFLGVIVTIVLSFLIRDIWALVIGFTLESVFRLILSFIICPFLPRVEFEKKYIKDIIKFAKGMLGLGLLFFIFRRVDVFVIGKLSTVEVLGLYSMASALAQMPFDAIASLLGKIGIASFARIKKEKEKVIELLFIITSFVCYLSIPAIFFIFFYGSEILSVTYGPRYAAVALPFAIIAFSAFLRFNTIPISNIYFANGQPELQRFFTLIRTVMIIIIIYPLTLNFGLVGAAMSILISMITGFLFQIFRLKRIYYFSIFKYFFIFFKAGFLALLVFFTWLLTYKYFENSNWLKLITGVTSCIFIYLIVLLKVIKKYFHKGKFEF